MIVRAISVGLMMSFLALPSAAAQNGQGALNLVEHVRDAQYTHVIDTRPITACETASLADARCLPLNHFFDPNGNAIGFHALRWLLGTVGLNGAERVLVIGANRDDSQRVGALLFSAGQAHVRILANAFIPTTDAPQGLARSLSREAVFTAPMRNAHGMDN